jgi:ribosomal peptide maturation radical SAM protein 1
MSTEDLPVPGTRPARVALISMPWMSVDLPSIQLATLAAMLRRGNAEADTFHFFVEYAADIGPALYRRLSDATDYVNEYVFCRQYFRAERDDELEPARTLVPSLGYSPPAKNDAVIDAVDVLAGAFLDRCADETDWSSYDLVGFSLTIAQTAASMALAQRIKARHPDVTIAFGGTSCAGPMGLAIARACPYVDMVVRAEGELVLGELVSRLSQGRDWHDLPHIAWRTGPEAEISQPGDQPVFRPSELPSRELDYDDYFARVSDRGLTGKVDVWLPFESSRGCWYGEKAQCRFCGLHEIMSYRSWSSDAVLAELDRLAERYGIDRFFSVDLIMPRDFYTSFLPTLAGKKKSWKLFYEIKANIGDREVQALADAGVRWIQPGIESLDDRILRSMRKGVHAAANVALLRLCAENGIRVTWNIISGLPGEEPQWYLDLARRVRSLFHTPPPSGVNTFELHRFSPYFDDAKAWGIHDAGASPFFRAIFPFDEELADDLCYRHSYTLDRSGDIREYTRPLRRAIAEWRSAAARGAGLTIDACQDGSASVLDTREAVPREHRLDQAEHQLYILLREVRRDSRLVQLAAAANGCAEQAIQQWVLRCLDTWHEAGLLWRSEGRSVALATPGTAPSVRAAWAALPAPVPYLDR